MRRWCSGGWGDAGDGGKADEKSPNRHPKDWNAAKVRCLIEYYENRSEDEAAAEIEQAKEVESPTWMRVPPELVPRVEKLIQRHRESA